ncbi:MAG: bifunctional oligoribonuclease/PAP phosphatase NrnA [Clostridia bacterium]|nr:bifunctional oligoribonuclease/PAP phosphatase NrnA [Clostridia bacterium]
MSLHDAVAFLNRYQSFLLFAHVSPDGDTLGSNLALQALLQQMGKSALVCCDHPVPHLYAFLPGAGEILPPDRQAEAEAAVFVDCADLERAGIGAQRAAGKPSLCIDHHITNPGYRGQGFADVNYIEDCAAAGELVCLLYEAMGVPMSPEAGLCLYTALSTDTGNFAYNSVSPRTFRLMSEVRESGFDLYEANRRLYRNKRLPKLRLLSRAVENARFYEDNQVAISAVSLSEMRELCAIDADCDGIVDELRDVETVQAACFLRQCGPKEVKLSLRSKDKVDCATLAQRFGGGGHIRAAGATIHADLPTAQAMITEALLTAFQKGETL